MKSTAAQASPQSPGENQDSETTLAVYVGSRTAPKDPADVSAQKLKKSMSSSEALDLIRACAETSDSSDVDVAQIAKKATPDALVQYSPAASERSMLNLLCLSPSSELIINGALSDSPKFKGKTQQKTVNANKKNVKQNALKKSGNQKQAVLKKPAADTKKKNNGAGAGVGGGVGGGVGSGGGGGGVGKKTKIKKAAKVLDMSYKARLKRFASAAYHAVRKTVFEQSGDKVKAMTEAQLAHREATAEFHKCKGEF